MLIAVVRAVLMFVALVLMSEVLANDNNAELEIGPYGEEEIADLIPYISNEKYIRHIHSMINAYRDKILDGRMEIETNALIDTKYKTWKRNADLINSLLALPKGMNDAGRR